MNELKDGPIILEDRIAMTKQLLLMALFMLVAVCGMLGVKWLIDSSSLQEKFGLQDQNWRGTESAPQDNPVKYATDEIQSLGHGVHVFSADDFPRRLAEFIDTNSQTIVVAVCPLRGDKSPGYLVLTRPDPEWLKILPGSAQPPNPGG